MKEKDRKSPPATQREEPGKWRELFTGLFNSGRRYSTQPLQKLLQFIRERDLIDSETLRMLIGTLRIADLQVRDIMVPRIHMRVLRENAPVEEWRTQVADSGHSRLPILKENTEQVIGMLLAKDLLTLAISRQNPTKEARDLVRKAYFVPESKRLNSLLREFRASRNHIAIVVDEYGGIAGLVTIEDIIEEIIGEIEDEHDRETAAHIEPEENGHFLIDGLTPIEEFNTYFSAQLKDGDYDTVGGLLLQQFGRLPENGEMLELDVWRFKVLQADKRRIVRIGLSRTPMHSPDDNDSSVSSGT